MTMKMSLREKAMEMNSQLPLMIGKTKADFDTLLGQTVTIRDYGFMQEDKKQYVAFTCDEYPDFFYFGGKVLTDDLLDFDKDGYGDMIRKEGLPTYFEEKQSKNKRNYTAVKYYPAG